MHLCSVAHPHGREDRFPTMYRGVQLCQRSLNNIRWLCVAAAPNFLFFRQPLPKMKRVNCVLTCGYWEKIRAKNMVISVCLVHMTFVNVLIIFVTGYLYKQIRLFIQLSWTREMGFFNIFSVQVFDIRVLSGFCKRKQQR